MMYGGRSKPEAFLLIMELLQSNCVAIKFNQFQISATDYCSVERVCT